MVYLINILASGLLLHSPTLFLILDDFNVLDDFNLPTSFTSSFGSLTFYVPDLFHWRAQNIYLVLVLFSIYTLLT